MTVDAAKYVQRLDCIDGSHYQPDAGPYNLATVRSASLGDTLMWKATQSTAYVDPTFRKIRAEALAVGFKMRLWYHWLSSTTNPLNQAAHYIRTIGELPPGEGVMLDAEENGITEMSCLQWCQAVEEHTKRPCSIYTGLYVAGGKLWQSQALRNSKYGPRPMHLAAYISRASLLARMTSLGVLHLPMHAWQWSSNGPVPGITGRCDMNTIVDMDIFRRACSLAGPVPIPPTPTPVPPTIPTPVPPTPSDFDNEESNMIIITNKEQFFNAAPNVWKALLLANGKLRYIASLAEYNARTSTVHTEIAWTNAEIAAAGVVA